MGHPWVFHVGLHAHGSSTGRSSVLLLVYIDDLWVYGGGACGAHGFPTGHRWVYRGFKVVACE